jgi:hypothetical protein
MGPHDRLAPSLAVELGLHLGANPSKLGILGGLLRCTDRNLRVIGSTLKCA